MAPDIHAEMVRGEEDDTGSLTRTRTFLSRIGNDRINQYFPSTTLVLP